MGQQFQKSRRYECLDFTSTRMDRERPRYQDSNGHSRNSRISSRGSQTNETGSRNMTPYE
ncbi:hypothetical protein HPB52_013768 [Rhipicephalus sanguineus]|uniref:Uncharacterized protein n=1 Tax=Rhipicephalus sanguineus TaxID=34632 RepID=A0A9D4QAS2_RHISA|nr:hypothetical protein HPB52_013768 [Rhipicephalus sanguineus]